MGTFQDNLRALEEEVGSGPLVASCEVDQVY